MRQDDGIRSPVSGLRPSEKDLALTGKAPVRDLSTAGTVAGGPPRRLPLGCRPQEPDFRLGS